jgi:hypothetical protein
VHAGIPALHSKTLEREENVKRGRGKNRGLEEWERRGALKTINVPTGEWSLKNYL